MPEHHVLDDWSRTEQRQEIEPGDDQNYRHKEHRKRWRLGGKRTFGNDAASLFGEGAGQGGREKGSLKLA